MEPALAIQDFLEYVISGLVADDGELSISREKRGDDTLFRIQLAPDEAGRVIGKHGKTISAIRSLVHASAEKHRILADVEVVREAI